MKRRSKEWDLTTIELQNIVNDCNSISDVLEKCGYAKNSGSMSKVLKNIIESKGVDISHFNPFARKNSGAVKHSLKDILVEDSSYTNISELKKRIVKEGLLKYECEKCGNTGEWNGKQLTLQLDHINGKHFDHRIENLRFLCPNCHSQTSTYSGRNAKYNVQN